MDAQQIELEARQDDLLQEADAWEEVQEILEGDVREAA